MKTLAWVKRSGRLSTTHVVVATQGDISIIACGKAVPLELEHREEGAKICARCHGNKNVRRNKHAAHVSLKTTEVSEAFNGWPVYKPTHRKVDPKLLCEACAWAYARQKQMWLCTKCRVKFQVDKIEFWEAGPLHLKGHEPED